MASSMIAVTLSDAVMGKKGQRYTIREIITILMRYDVLPLAHGRRPRKLPIFQQLHELAHNRNLTRDDRICISRDSYRQELTRRRSDQDRRRSLDVHTVRAFPSSNITSSCRHDPLICLGCLTQAIDSQIGDRTWDMVSCPPCPEKLSFETVKKYSSAASFDRYVIISKSLSFYPKDN